MAAILMIDDEQAILELVKKWTAKRTGHFVTAYTSAAQVPLDKLNRYDFDYTGYYDAWNLRYKDM